MNTEPCLKNMAWKLTNVISFDSHGQLLQSYFSTLPVFLRSGPEVIYRVLLRSTLTCKGGYAEYDVLMLKKH